ncbi:MAG: hypothetical protein JG777_2606 [Clostridia bacterium]|jgi:hypothetical protein|nr:hypothetical protein [Clostridia bacterium]
MIPKELIEKIQKSFTEREIVILASTAAQVNYWALKDDGKMVIIEWMKRGSDWGPSADLQL